MEWMDMPEAEKQVKGPLDVYLKNLVDEEMESYMSTKDNRMLRILETIGKGYDASVSRTFLLSCLWFHYFLFLLFVAKYLTII